MSEDYMKGKNPTKAADVCALDECLEDLNCQLQKAYETEKEAGIAPEMPKDMEERLRGVIQTYSPQKRSGLQLLRSTFRTRENRRRMAFCLMKRFGFTAAILGVLLFTNIGGMSVAGTGAIGTPGQWTNSAFSFQATPYYEAVKNRYQAWKGKQLTGPARTVPESVQAFFQSNGVPGEFVLSWLPADAEVQEMESVEVGAAKNCFVYLNDSHNRTIWYLVRQYASNQGRGEYSKDAGPVETLELGGKLFYLFKNGDFWCAAWQKYPYETALAYNGSREEFMKMLYSIGGIERE